MCTIAHFSLFIKSFYFVLATNCDAVITVMYLSLSFVELQKKYTSSEKNATIKTRLLIVLIRTWKKYTYLKKISLYKF